MFYIAVILMTAVLLKVAEEDWKYRTVHLYWFIALFLILAWINIEEMGLGDFALRYLYNVLFIGVQLLLVNAYFCLKERRLFWIFDRYLGWGDVAFLLAIAGAWSLGAFFLFFIGSLVLILVFTMVYLRKENIPLAGLQALLFLVCYFLEYVGVLSLESVLLSY